jgi:hypothetical protein
MKYVFTLVVSGASCLLELVLITRVIWRFFTLDSNVDKCKLINIFIVVNNVIRDDNVSSTLSDGLIATSLISLFLIELICIVPKNITVVALYLAAVDLSSPNVGEGNSLGVIDKMNSCLQVVLVIDDKVVGGSDIYRVVVGSLGKVIFEILQQISITCLVRCSNVGNCEVLVPGYLGCLDFLLGHCCHRVQDAHFLDLILHGGIVPS